MSRVYNIYCDESCHLEKDRQQVMVLGATWCPLERRHQISARLREIKQKAGLSPNFEVKWVKVSKSKVQFYLDWIDYFFDNDDLHFRALIVPDKTKLRHKAFESQDHEVWYYKMYFDMLKVIFHPDAHYRVYLDMKDTHSSRKVRKLHEVLCNNIYDFSRDIIERLQVVRSHEVDLLQLTDLLIGAISYANRELAGNEGKKRLVERIKNRSGYSLTATTLLLEEKINLFRWHAQEI